jgi:hypothetical protein
MGAIDEAVTAKLRAQRGQDDALALWRELWAAYEAGGVDAAAALLEARLHLPGDDEVER